ncbi:hypothetical protein CTA1_5145 [Colletotrichum tanaceti]|uniref:PiggyBac transposable element-derived protein domain-containing protein n=1 Tax=Colletotrichum tanaceti TaxID=1306861 RepID=A0A4U6XK37_9PEZI|nr:hypothetical protein CTA1_5145 [Colletotrichum tanaceti]
MSAYASYDSDPSGASGAVSDCIVIQPPDLAVACNQNCLPERCEYCTVRPDEAPQPGPPGTVPFQAPVQAPAEVSALPDTELDLFFQYVPYRLVEQWVTWTNSYSRTIDGPNKPYPPSDTTVNEVYLFLSILVCMAIHPSYDIQTYWYASASENSGVTYGFTRYMSLGRVETLFRRLRISSPSDSQPSTAPPSPTAPAKPYARPQVPMPEVWSAHIKEALADSFKLQRDGNPVWKPMRDQYKWRETIAGQLIRRFGSSAEAH